MTYTSLQEEFDSFLGSDPNKDVIDLSLLEDFDSIDEDSSSERFVFSNDETLLEKKNYEYTQEKVCIKQLLIQNSRNIFLSVALTLAGAFTMLFTQWLNYEKIADETNLITNLSWYLGQALVGLLPSVDPEKDKRFLKDIKAKKKTLWILKGIGALDLFCGFLIIGGFFKVGSSLFQIIYSLSIPITALVARAFLKRRMNAIQWIVIIVIVFGFSVNTFMPYMLHHPSAAVHLTHNQQASQNNVVFGILLTVLGVIIGAGAGVATEKIILKSTNPSPTMLCRYIGTYGTILCFIIQILFVLPQRYSIVRDTISNAFSFSESRASKEALLYFFKLFGGFSLLTIIHIFQHYANFLLIEAWGVVPTGILSALKSVFIIIFSSLLFCSQDSKQCFTAGKVTSASIIILGITLYNVASLKKTTTS